MAIMICMEAMPTSELQTASENDVIFGFKNSKYDSFTFVFLANGGEDGSAVAYRNGRERNIRVYMRMAQALTFINVNLFNRDIAHLGDQHSSGCKKCQSERIVCKSPLHFEMSATVPDSCATRALRMGVCRRTPCSQSKAHTDQLHLR